MRALWNAELEKSKKVTRLKGYMRSAGTCAGSILVLLQTLRWRIAYNAQRRERKLSTGDAHDDG